MKMLWQNFLMFELNLDFQDMKYVFVIWFGNKQLKQCFSKKRFIRTIALTSELGSLYIAFYSILTVLNTPQKQKRQIKYIQMK